jgi:hypothetical protein
VTTKTIVSVTDRLKSSHVHYGNDTLYRDELSDILKEVVAIAGPVVKGADWPVFAQGATWCFMLGAPRDGQEHYIEFMREADAVFYVLAHGGQIIEQVEDVELAWAK